MYFRFDCSHCGKSLKVRDDAAGQKARCPYCHKHVLVPTASVEGGEQGDSGGEAADSMLHLDPGSIPVARAKSRDTSSAAPPPASATSVSSADRSDGTNVSLAFTALIGAILAAIFLAVLLPFKSTYFGELFLDRGWVPFVLTFLLGWSAAIVFMKWRKLQLQSASMLFDLLPNELGYEITPQNLNHFTAHVREIPVEPSRSFLVNRVLRGLEHFRVRRSTAEVSSVMQSQSDIDANAVDSSYSIVKVFIWAIPILGFIGTVMGISEAVGSFDSAINAADVTTEGLTDSLSGITGGLSKAFDTTLVALVMSLIVMFPVSSMQKAEEDLLNWVDEYCNENLLKRLNEGEPIDQPREKIEVDEQIQIAIDAAMTGNQGGMLQKLADVQKAVADIQQTQVARLEQAMQGLAERTESTQHEVANSMLQTSENLRRYFDKLEGGLTSLNTVLRHLGEEQVVIQVKHPPRRGWFGLGKVKDDDSGNNRAT